MSRNCLILIFLFELWSCSFVKAQGKIEGFVRSKDSTLIKDALVLLPELHKSCLSDRNGHYQFDFVIGPSVELQVIQSGFLPYISTVRLSDSLTRKNVILEPRLNNLDEIVIYGAQQSKRSETANSIDILETSTMRALGAMNLSDGMAKIPGVSQLTTGPGISKPVIRGLFGNRIQTVLLGMRFDNQQWQDEHGLGLSDIGVDRIEIIKGASSLLYGSEAMGGVINIINEKPAPEGQLQADVSTRYFSNTYGYGIDAGVKKSNSKLNWAFRLGNESHADYSDGNGTRILNSRFGGTVAKGTIGFQRKRWVSENNYLFSQSNYGFIMDAYQLISVPDDRLSRSFERPHHTVTVNLFSTQNTFLLKASRLKCNFGIHINERQEQEGSGGISLDMLLKTFTAFFLWEKSLNDHLELSAGSQNQYQTNTNLGSRIIVPDANLGETSLFTYLKNQSQYYVVEGGLRFDHKTIQTLSTDNLNNGDPYKPGTSVLPQTKIYNTFNGSIGISLFDRKHMNSKVNLSSGYRGPNLAELSSNGLHEGTSRYEVGNMNLKIEQNLCVDLYNDYYNKWITIHMDLYSNHFLNYIYLQPDTQEYLGFKIYRYVQKNAVIKGLEGGLTLHPPLLKWLEFDLSYSAISGLSSEHEYLPFIPAQKLNSQMHIKFKEKQRLRMPFMNIGYTYVFSQNKPGQFETSTPSYDLLFISAGAELNFNKHKLLFSISGNNLLNEVYFDHLSRYKYYGIYNIGRSVSINIKYQFN